MRLKVVVAAVVLIPVLVGCRTSDPPDTNPTGTPAGGPALADTQWNLSGTGNDVGNMVASNITLEFTADRATGFAGVGNYSASYTSDPAGTLKFSDISAEKAAGMEGALQAQEQYLKTLESVTGFTATGKTLALFAGDKQVYIYVSG